MVSKKKLSKCKGKDSLQKWCLILSTTATIATAIATLTAVTIELTKFLL